jgi:hypothetical protein
MALTLEPRSAPMRLTASDTTDVSTCAISTPTDVASNTG